MAEEEDGNRTSQGGRTGAQPSLTALRADGRTNGRTKSAWVLNLNCQTQKGSGVPAQSAALCHIPAHLPWEILCHWQRPHQCPSTGLVKPTPRPEYSTGLSWWKSTREGGRSLNTERSVPLLPSESLSVSLRGKKACLYSGPASLGHHAVGWAKADKQSLTEPGLSRHSGAPGPTEAFVAIGDLECFSVTQYSKTCLFQHTSTWKLRERKTPSKLEQFETMTANFPSCAIQCVLLVCCSQSERGR